MCACVYAVAAVHIVGQDEYNLGVPAAWGLLANEQTSTFVNRMLVLKQAVEAVRLGWRPSAFIMNACDVEAKAIRYDARRVQIQCHAKCLTARCLLLSVNLLL